MRRILPLACLLLIVSMPARAAHPLTVDDAGTLDPAAVELELSSAMMDSEFGPAHGVGVAARLGLSGSLDSGLGVAWFDIGDEDSGYEFVLDLKFAPGEASGWRPRPFLRSDFAVIAVSDVAELSFASLCGGLTWELGQAVVSAEACWCNPLKGSDHDASAWSTAAGIFLPVHRRATVAAEYRLGEWGDFSTDIARIGFLTQAGRGNLSLGAEIPVAGSRFDEVVALLGWTAEFGL